MKTSEIDIIKAILEGKIKNKETIGVRDAFLRYIKLFPNSELNKYESSIEILINNRNEIVHNINLNNVENKEVLIGIISNVFSSFIKEAEDIIGVLNLGKVKKERKYTEKEIQNIFDKEVLAKIDKNINNNDLIRRYGVVCDDLAVTYPLLGKEECPRCGNYSFSKNDPSLEIYRSILYKNKEVLYICSNCNLELTELEYKTVKRLEKESKIISHFKRYYQ